VAEAAAGARVLLVSTDPAHSLGDALAVKLSAQPRRIKPGLDAVELDAPRAFARWLKEHRRPLREILEHGTWLDHEDVDALLDLSIPGIDELVGLLEIARLASCERKARIPRRFDEFRVVPSAVEGRQAQDERSSRARRASTLLGATLRPSKGRGRRPLRSNTVVGYLYDVIVVDTAPTGHTLRLLAAPEAVAAVADVLDVLQQEHRLIREQLARVGRPEAADTLIALLAAQARETAEHLHDPRQTAFHWVTLPEELSLAESNDAIAALERAGMHVPEIVVNRVLPDAGPCPVCDRRRADERRVLAAIRRRYGRGRRVRTIPAAMREPRGVVALAAIARGLTTQRSTTVDAEDTEVKSVFALSVPRVLRGRERAVSVETLDAIEGASLLFFGGKGGVGKTTVAAAAALGLARADPSRRVLLLSTDPAHSLADVFKSAAGDTAHAIRGGPRNLLVRELDAAGALAARRTQFESALDEIASAAGTSAITADLAANQGMSVHVPASGIGRELMNLAPPGIDELFGIISVVDARAAYDVIVVDTAPTGHALRLLEMPDAARAWTQVLLRVLLKYRSLVRPGQLAAELVDVSKSIRELQMLLRDARQTRFIAVTRAAEVPRRETERLLTRLRGLHLSTPALVVNALTMSPGRCARCRATAAAERRELAALRRPRGCVIIRTPLSAPPPRGVKALERWGASWISAD
jgi:arsenite-transporting ATPase